MRLARWGWLVLWLVGCPKPATSTFEAGPVHPDLQCPPGTFSAGKVPPVGWEAWCEKPLPGGGTARQGPALQWHTNEARKAEGAYVDGKAEGPWLYWYPTGTPQMQGQFVLGVRTGIWTSYHPDGERASEGEYVDGKEHGPWTFWNADTLTRTEGEYVLGDRDGVWIDFGPDDIAVRERIYRGGRMISMREID